MINRHYDLLLMIHLTLILNHDHDSIAHWNSMPFLYLSEFMSFVTQIPMEVLLSFLLHCLFFLNSIVSLEFFLNLIPSYVLHIFPSLLCVFITCRKTLELVEGLTYFMVAKELHLNHTLMLSQDIYSGKVQLMILSSFPWEVMDILVVEWSNEWWEVWFMECF